MTPEKWIEAGGLALFAFSVWMEVRSIRLIIDATLSRLVDGLLKRENL